MTYYLTCIFEKVLQKYEIYTECLSHHREALIKFILIIGFYPPMFKIIDYIDKSDLKVKYFSPAFRTERTTI